MLTADLSRTRRGEAFAFPRVDQFFSGASWMLCVLFVARNIPAQAEPNAPTDSVEAVSLAQASRLAFLRNWDLLAARADIEIAAAQRIVAREFPNPTVSLSTLKINVDHYPSATRSGNGFWD